MVEYIRYIGNPGDGVDTHKWKSYKAEYEWAKRQTHDKFNESWRYRLLPPDERIAHIIDPFARNCGWGTITNDIDPRWHTDYHLDGADFLEDLADQKIKAKIILFDPPFSDRQNEDKYEHGTSNLYCTGDGRIGRCGIAIKKLLFPGGICIKLGYNSNAPTKGLELIRLATVSFGGTRNDVIISHWINPNNSLYSYQKPPFKAEDGQEVV